ncbi:DoxX family protein [Corynebacterium lowii]|uniref:DoxX n=1 Tax=Corynebacterium lowii TaxID=1544413 RepID=A0A0Q0UEU0_9CORY|nr:DoxX family protein [Corynebacterium lowii]KQB86409.1 hypothetical protein Clow_01329 [Corynebacterium lowii]MDP9850894.1 putative membrane protein YphA (DoxX/SURF4 family) [Corynebacterium lowii]
MSQDPSTPDRADKAAADDLDIPTFQPPEKSPEKSQEKSAEPKTQREPVDPYKKVGRAAPQEIRPREPEEKTKEEPVAAEEPVVTREEKKEEVTPAAKPEQPQQPRQEDRSAPLLSDAPTRTIERPVDKPKAQEKQEAVAEPAAPAAPTAVMEREQESAASYAGAAAPVVEDDSQEQEEESRRGTLDFGLLILRLTVGVWLILNSLSDFFHLGTSEGLSGLEAQYSAYVAPQALSVAIPAAGLAAGVFLVLGLITPLFAAAATVVAGFGAIDALAHAGVGMDVFSWPEGLWLFVILGGASVALQFTGPGVYSLDFSRGWARRPLASSWVGVILSIAGLVALWWFGAGINPLA